MMPKEIHRALEGILPTVQKPGRYIGYEHNQVVKDWSQTPMRVALAFPDIYDLGMSNLGLAILYDIINKQPDMLAERVFAPWPDMEAALRHAGVPLYSLETKHPVAEFDVLGISLPYETLYTNALNVLDLAGIPLLTSERNRDDPLVIAGGHATFNPEPMTDFFDAFVIGEGEEVILDIVHCLEHWRNSLEPRASLHRALSKIEGVYVPSLYHVYYQEDGIISNIETVTSEAQLPIKKRIVPQLPPSPTRFIVPYVDITHNRIPIEIMRGCTRGCRFCQAGMITRPVRERSVGEVINAVEQALSNTGFEEVGLLSLSSSDYSQILDLVHEMRDRFTENHVTISLPSLRIESFSVELMDILKGRAHRGGFTLAPESASSVMCEIINKPVLDQQLLHTTREIFKRGWHTIKLYFMIGLPMETMKDVQAIVDLCKAVIEGGHNIVGKRARVHVSVGTFVPKPHTPFQWVTSDPIDQIRIKQTYLKSQLRGHGFKLNWNEPRQTLLETWLSRGDRRLGQVVLEAWKGGAKFDAWQEYFNFEAWDKAFEATGLDPDFYTIRQRSIDEILPWDHIDAGIKKQFLIEDYHWSLEGRSRADCREQCYACGIIAKFAELRSGFPEGIWKCPEMRSPNHKKVEAKSLPPI